MERIFSVFLGPALKTNSRMEKRFAGELPKSAKAWSVGILVYDDYCLRIGFWTTVMITYTPDTTLSWHLRCSLWSSSAKTETNREFPSFLCRFLSLFFCRPAWVWPEVVVWYRKQRAASQVRFKNYTKVLSIAIHYAWWYRLRIGSEPLWSYLDVWYCSSVIYRKSIFKAKKRFTFCGN